MTETIQIGYRLRSLIVQSGRSIHEVADRSQTSYVNLHRILNGTVPNPGILAVARIVEGAGGTMRELFEEGEV